MTSPTYNARKAGGREIDAVDAPSAAASLPPGRGSDTRDRIRAAARALFSGGGFLQISSGTRRRCAKGSKRSHYNYAGDMAGFFIAVVKNKTSCAPGPDRLSTVCVAVKKAVHGADALAGGLFQPASTITLGEPESAAGG